MRPLYVDSHCHLDYPDFADDHVAMLARAQGAGVGAMLTICTTLAGFPGVRRVADAPNIWCTVGIHPHNVEKEPDVTPETLLGYAEDKKVAGFGETGLDYYYEYSDRALQQRSFRAHIAAARTLQLPVIVHTRDAEEDTLAILEEEYARGAFPGLIHCFTASADFARRVRALGFYISVSGIVTFKSAAALQETVRALPLECLLVETDSPYLAPLPHRGKRNEPAWVVQVAEKIALLKDIAPETVGHETTANFFRLFRRCTAPAQTG